MKSFSVGMAALALGLAAAPAARAAPPAQHKNQAQQNAHAMFAKWDLDNDGSLDAAELAKAFRGPKAKPIDGKPTVNDQHPDHAFLARFDTDKDGKISRAEFERFEKTLVSRPVAQRRPATYSRTHRPSYYRGPVRHRPGHRR